MISSGSATRIFLAAGATDMRRSYDGLADLVRSRLQGEPLSGHWFVFCNQRRNRIMLEVRETNLSAQLFFRANGFRAVSLLREFYEDTPEDAYLMQFSYVPEAFESSELRVERRAG